MSARIPNSERLGWWAAALAIGASILFLLSQASHFGLVVDDWDLLLRRPGWSAADFLAPFHENVIVAPAFIYKVLQAIFGMGSFAPYYAVALALIAVAAGLLFAFLRARVGSWLALCGLLPILFLGAAAEDLYWAFQIGVFGSVAAGVGMLIALGREDRGGDRVACALLLVTLSFSSVGIAFVIAAVVDLALGRGPRRERVFVVGLPILIYAVWYLGWGHQDQHHITIDNLVHLPAYVLDAAGAAVASVAGQEPAPATNPEEPLLAFKLVALALGVAVGFRIWRDRGCSRGLAVALVLLIAFWVLAGLDSFSQRPPTSQRYQYPAVVFLVIVFAEALEGVRLRVSAKLVAAALALFAVVSGARLLERERGLWDNLGQATRATLGGVELAGPALTPGYVITEQWIDTPARLYLSAVGKYGSPAFDEAEILAAAPLFAEFADQSLVSAEGLRLRSANLAHGPCRAVAKVRRKRVTTPLAQGAWVIENAGDRPAELRLARFSAAGASLSTTIAPGRSRHLVLPVDASDRPWRIGAEVGSVRLCDAATPSAQARPAAIATRSSPVAKR